MEPNRVNARRGPGIPGARNVDHFAISVPDLEQAVDFFVRHLGASLLSLEGPFACGPWMVENLAVPADATCRVAMLRFGPTMNLELFQYDVAARRSSPRNCDVGACHVAVYVDDDKIDDAFGYIYGLPGVTCQGEVKRIADGPLAGDRWVYFTTPWGLQMELKSVAPASPYARLTRERRYGPHPGQWNDGHAGTGEE